MVSLKRSMKFLKPMYSPTRPIMLSVRESQIPKKKGYAMNTMSRIAPGNMRIIPRLVSRSNRPFRKDKLDRERMLFTFGK